MPETADQAVDTAVGLDVNGAADRVLSLLPDEEHGEQEPEASPSSQAPAGEQEPEVQIADEDATEQPVKQPAQSQTYTVKVDGKETQVTLDELIGGYSRTADYTQKTQRLAQERRDFDAEFAAVKQERAKYGELLKKLDASMAELEKQPNWDELRQSDPLEFATQWAQFQQRQQARAAIRAEQERLAQQQMLDNQRQLQERVQAEEALLVKAIPAWADKAKATEEKKALMEFGIRQGFTTEELNGIYDHRVILLLRKAMRYDQAVAKAAAARSAAPSAPTPVLHPGQGAKRPSDDATRIRKRLAETGSVEDAAALIMRSL
jgi:hypothetical protein